MNLNIFKPISFHIFKNFVEITYVLNISSVNSLQCIDHLLRKVPIYRIVMYTFDIIYLMLLQFKEEKKLYPQESQTYNVMCFCICVT